jgi:hypothetical protein
MSELNPRPRLGYSNRDMTAAPSRGLGSLQLTKKQGDVPYAFSPLFAD